MNIKYFHLNELFILKLWKADIKIPGTLKYYQKYLPVKNEIESLLNDDFRIKRKKNHVIVNNPDKYPNQRYLLRLCSSDRKVLRQVITEDEYLPIINLIKEKGFENSIKFIVDAGSNIGFSSIYFNSFFPDAQIIAIEPDESNYDHLLKNLAINKLDNKIICLKKALWTNNSDSLVISNDFRDRGYWSRSVKSSSDIEEDSVPSITLSDVIKQYGSNQIIDILKMDIEGSEAELFKTKEFLYALSNSVRFFCLEIHHEFNIGEHIRSIFLENDLDFFDIGETTFCFNRNLDHK
jgi:FkbM family methyltransferase